MTDTYAAALAALRAAWSRFDATNGEEHEIAMLEVKAAEKRVDLIVKEARGRSR